MYSFIVAEPRLDVIFLAFVLQVASIVPISIHEPDSWEKMKVIILSGFLFIFQDLEV